MASTYCNWVEIMATDDKAFVSRLACASRNSEWSADGHNWNWQRN